jgi:hypothetical protein
MNGKITLTVRASHVDIKVRLLRWWERLMNWTPNRKQMDTLVDLLLAAAAFAEQALKVSAVLLLIFVTLEIIMAFLPGGTVSQVLGGLR